MPFQAHRIARILEYGPVAGKCVDRNPMDYYKMMYGDTVMYNNVAALNCGLAFFGAEHMLFATDMPLGASGGDRVIRDTIKAVEAMDCSEADKQKIFETNAVELFRLPPR